MYELLRGSRALDLTDERGYLCGLMLAQIGVDVIKIERPGGDSGRRLGPFYHDIPDPENSLFWFAYNLNKKGITLDIEKADGREIFKKLVKTADFVLESSKPGYLDSLGLGYAGLSEINNGIILTSISPFGHTGPYRDYKASGLVASAMGGMMYVSGEPDRPPVRVSFDQSYLLGASHAAVGAMLAHYHRELTGEGQWVDTSVQGCWTTSFINMMSMWELAGTVPHRAGSMRLSVGRKNTMAYPCKDGYISYMILLGLGGVKPNTALVEWMDSEGMADEYLKSIDWTTFSWSNTNQEQLDAIQERLGKFFLTHTTAELMDGFIQRRIMGLPFSTFADLLQSPQLEYRDYWQEVDYPELGDRIKHPGAPVKLSEMTWHTEKRAPLIGEHNEEIYVDELGLSRQQLINLKQSGVI